jgi:hypothetical protein
MSHWAEIDENNIVLRVVVGNNNDHDEGEAFMKSLGGTWVKTSYNGSIRKNYAGVGMFYDANRDAFIPSQPYPSWILNEETCLWNAPAAYPIDGDHYAWDEQKTAWVKTADKES